MYFIIEGIGGVQWSDDRVTLTSPTPEECEEVMSQLKRQRQAGMSWRIVLQLLSSDCLLIVLSNIKECLVRGLDIWDTPLNNQCVLELSNVLTCTKTMEYLDLNSSPLSPNSIEIIFTSLSNNNTLKRLWITDEKTITDKEIPCICQMLAVNTTLEKVQIYQCPNITQSGEQKLSTALANNKTLTTLCVNGHYLCQ